MVYLIEPKNALPVECQTYCWLKCVLCPFDNPQPLYGMPPD